MTPDHACDMREHRRSALQAGRTCGTLNHQHLLARHDIHRQDPKTVPEIALIDARLVYGEKKTRRLSPQPPPSEGEGQVVGLPIQTRSPLAQQALRPDHGSIPQHPPSKARPSRAVTVLQILAVLFLDAVTTEAPSGFAG